MCVVALVFDVMLSRSDVTASTNNIPIYGKIMDFIRRIDGR
jgi:hypothetical protein